VVKTSAGRDAVPAGVLAAYGFAGAAAHRVPGGLINETYLVGDAAAPHAIAQRLHAIFAAEVNVDIDVVTAHLAAAGVDTPRLLSTEAGDLWCEAEDHAIWRMMTHVAGTTVHQVGDPRQAEAAGALAARFHRALGTLQHRFAFARVGVHDTAAHMARLQAMLDGRDRPAADVTGLGQDILAAYRGLDYAGALGALPRHICHGDLKISNVRFAAEDSLRALCLIDLDTLGYQTMAYELGDALRSWCNPRGEDVPAPTVDATIFAAAIRGYASTGRGTLDAAEIDAIVPGLETVCIELAARFCVDAVADRYFGWDASRFASRREHNLLRAHGQLALARSVADQRRVLDTAVDRELRGE
jgi:Ser/Thr protein kinase RdoA (MazF antagonist)